MKTLPNLFVLGAPRSGTSFLCSALSAHPEIFAPPVKEPHFFVADRWPHNGPEQEDFIRPLQDYLDGKARSAWGGVLSDPAAFEALYAPGAGHTWRLEGTPNYLHSGPDVARRILGACPDMRALVVLRDPADRALSHYNLFVQNGWEDLPFDAALDAVPERLAKGWTPAWDYIRFSVYGGPLTAWRALLGARLKVIAFDDLVWSPAENMADIYSWLGLEPVPFKAERALNPAAAGAAARCDADAALRATGWIDLEAERAVVDAARSSTITPPRVSIGMPVRNGAGTIAAALQSLQQQTYPNIRITVCDNASDDGTTQIVEAISARDPRVRLQRFEELADIRESYARALATADGAYFLFAPSDDSWAPGFLAAAVGRMQADPGIAVCCGRIQLFDDGGRRWPSAGITPIRGSAARRWQRALIKSGDAARLYGLIRRDALENLFPATAPQGWDHYSAAKLALRGEIAVLDMDAMERHQTPADAYRAHLAHQETGFWGQVFFMRHVLRLFREDPDFDTRGLGARAALLCFLLQHTDMPLRRRRLGWLRWLFRRAAGLSSMVARLAVPK